MLVAVLNGAKPGETPMEQPTSYELVFNQKTAKTLGIAIQPALRLRADRVIESPLLADSSHSHFGSRAGGNTLETTDPRRQRYSKSPFLLT